MIDYLIIGGGLAGVSFASLLADAKKSFILIDNNHQDTPSQISCGLFQPFILKRSTVCWRGTESMDTAPSFFGKIEALTKTNFINLKEIRYIFPNPAAHNEWALLKDKHPQGKFIDPQIYSTPINPINTPFGWSKVLKSGRVDIKGLCNSFKSYLNKTNQLLIENFNYDKLSVEENHVEYKNLKAKRVVFAEGFGIKQNPFFKYLPLTGSKGELLTLKIPSLKLNHPLKSPAFIVPLEQQLYKVGTTYNWQDKTTSPTDEGKRTILNLLEKTLNADYELIDHQAAIRPTTADRRPLVGIHKKHKPLAILNGLGTRGILNSPYISKSLFDFLEHEVPVPNDISIERFSR